MNRWKLEDAKNHFSEIVRRAIEHQPQHVTRNGKDVVVVMSAKDYARLVAPQDLVRFLRESPLAEAVQSGELKIERDRDFGRDAALKAEKPSS